jgi:hypothetical protein
MNFLSTDGESNKAVQSEESGLPSLCVLLLTYCHYVGIHLCIHSTIEIFRRLANSATIQ